MLRYFQKTFVSPRNGRWFRSGLVIHSAAPHTAEPALRKLSTVFPGVTFNLLALRGSEAAGFRDVVSVRRRLGGLRLLLKARRHYDLVIFFASGEAQLRLCRAVALVAMRPVRFFVFNEFGEGFWLHHSNWGDLCNHVERRYDLAARARRWRAWLQKVVLPIRRRLNEIAAAVTRLAMLLVRFCRICLAGAAFAVAMLILLALRLSYDTRSYRFRFFGRTAAAPRRNLSSRELVASLKPPAV